MKKKRDILNEAVNALKNQPVPDGPPQQTLDSVTARLSEAGAGVSPAGRRQRPDIISLAKIAAAAILLIMSGIVVGRLTSPRPPDLQQLQQELEPSLRASLQPAIRQDLLDELKKSWRLAWAGTYVQLKDDLGRQFSSDMAEFGAQILAASGQVTDRRLTELIHAINAAQIDERRSIAAALEQIEQDRLQDKSLLINGIQTLAAQTDDELTRTKRELAQFLVYAQPESAIPDESNNSKPSNERNEK
ncbi:MAG TPA: hypothetical protein VMX13_07885 [Sedimentisphaerales bacterium]|nr:hypothetical protein [Sedimentisphaerales bacterium]